MTIQAPPPAPLLSPFMVFLLITLPLAAVNLVNQASRTVMAIIGPLMAVEFSLSASELGFLASCMFAAYGAAQLPVGIALDMFGPRRVQAALSLLSAAGFALFAVADGMAGFAVARAIMGIGVSAALIAIIKANTQWLKPVQVANMTGLAMVVGTLGSVVTTVPVQAVLPALGWRGVFWVLCAAALGIAVWIFFSVRDRQMPARRGGFASEAKVVGAIVGSGRFWRYGPGVAMLSVLNFTYLGLWAGPWLRDVAGYAGPARAHTLLLYTLCLMAGGLSIGWMASRAQARGWPPLMVPTLCALGQLAAQAGLIAQPSGALAVNLLWGLFGFCAAAGPSGYIAVAQMFPPEQNARVSTAINTLTLVGAFLLQSAIGWILDQWPRTLAHGWDPHGYSAALGFSVAVQAGVTIGLALSLLPGRRRDTAGFAGRKG